MHWKRIFKWGMLLVSTSIIATTIEELDERIKKTEHAIYALRSDMAQQYQISSGITSPASRQLNEIRTHMESLKNARDLTDLDRSKQNLEPKLHRVVNGEKEGIVYEIQQAPEIEIDNQNIEKLRKYNPDDLIEQYSSSHNYYLGTGKLQQKNSSNNDKKCCEIQ